MPFIDLLEDQLGDFVEVIITAGQGCCLQEGILCQVGLDFITLIDGDERIEIPFDAIAAVRKLAGGAPPTPTV
ncbi:MULTISPECIES: hypothetical protein [unclassified Candidatus Frackibacter]|uniref:hypothetical protein n=1 Tax=unclassified Candidatus Frackibacter TaxID=2648818 RepID=UPI00079C1E00|nr:MULTISPECIES: hypothetical protein [unclassified Candidatus Frackibacter]KXS40634.1 MAG: hypothetical protein AWU54_1899 [Candidatus Frackibacter sp. T328-2]SDC15631.1 hypothetical protein SAMN04515661_10324 [Candidatus Frackibacter sp. WG11]SEM46020.1 hypothetical protein SAMN04488698_104118 [Candidatus Frackibacter sp. WG12]SFL48174.1 hypothetical protein SAMN04488699_103117 [Candidatus Frackibacter sp. WG13]